MAQRSSLIHWSLHLQELSFMTEYCMDKLNNAPDPLSWTTVLASLALYTPPLTQDEKFCFPLTDKID